MVEHTADGSSVLAEELRQIVNQAEALLNAMGEDGDAATAALRERVNDSIDAARSRLADIEEQAHRVSQRAAGAAEAWVRDNPWSAVLIAAGLGLVIGTLLARRASSRPEPE
jgi:ElaB/YqjD/DUF883 family membrane-anchored ribosome-binding protein